MHRLLLSIFTIALLFQWTTSFGQVQSKKATKLYESAVFNLEAFRFNEAINTLEQVRVKYPTFFEAQVKLGEALFKTERFNEVEATISPLIDKNMNANLLGKCHLMLAHIYIKQENHEQSLHHLNKSIELAPELNSASVKRLINLEKEPAPTTRKHIEALPDHINQFSRHSNPVKFSDKLYYTASIVTEFGSASEKIMVTKEEDQNWSLPEQLPGLWFKENHGGLTINQSGDQIIFSVCYHPEGQGDCDLFQSSLTSQGEWGKPEIMSDLNSPAWEGDPFLSSDGDLYFSSDREGGMGKRDLWVAKKNNNKWGRPVNLSVLNSTENEISPFYDPISKKIYFSSNGHKGEGGYDIIYSKSIDNEWNPISNAGKEINSSANETGYFVDTEFYTGYLVRQNQSGSKIYTFDAQDDFESSSGKTIYKGLITDKKTSLPIESTVKIFEVGTEQEVAKLTSSKHGKFEVLLDKTKDYVFYYKSKGYLYASQEVDADILSFLTNVNTTVLMEPIEKNAKIVTKNITFETGKYELHEASLTELMIIVHLLESNPELKIEIGGHTDNVGSESSNIKLSNNRARSVSQFLEKNGVESNRIQHKGYGSSQPVESNQTKKGRAKNRRIEIKVI